MYWEKSQQFSVGMAFRQAGFRTRVFRNTKQQFAKFLLCVLKDRYTKLIWPMNNTLELEI